MKEEDTKAQEIKSEIKKEEDELGEFVDDEKKIKGFKQD